MACMTLFAQPLAMATTQPARVIHYQDALEQLEGNLERNSLPMSWVVVNRWQWGQKNCKCSGHRQRIWADGALDVLRQ
ncbi:MAG TPA: hypothetical protein VMQ17_25170 [Candidatus Sulfotelmatobacter sp.]|jgi:hypothetical protein|nr:hypothetical protein [Candidatus Sulfotelmatobacter sp.]